MKDLLEIKKIITTDELYYLETENKNTGWIGCASFYTNGEDKIYVNEGAPDGSDDAGYTYNEFINKYEYQLKREWE